MRGENKCRLSCKVSAVAALRTYTYLDLLPSLRCQDEMHKYGVVYHMHQRCGTARWSHERPTASRDKYRLHPSCYFVTVSHVPHTSIASIVSRLQEDEIQYS